MKIADPKPGFCSCCFGAHPDRQYIDFEADYDGAPVLDRETNSIAVLPWNGQLGGHDNLYLCETCVREAAEKLAFKPELHQRQFQAVRRAELTAEHYKDQCRRLQDALNRQLEADLGDPEPRRTTRRKAA